MFYKKKKNLSTERFVEKHGNALKNISQNL